MAKWLLPSRRAVYAMGTRKFVNAAGIRLHASMLSQLGLPATPISEITRARNGRTRTCVVEPATEADLDELSELLGELFAQESDFRPDKHKQLRGLRLIFEQPSRGRV